MRALTNRIRQLLPYGFKHRINRLRQQIFNLWWLRSLIREYRFRVLGQAPIIIFQVGKVGSMSVYTSLRRSGFFVFHHHTLSPDAIENAITRIDPDDKAYHFGLRTGLWLYKNVIQAGKPVRIITITRGPISAMVSAYFETLDRHTGLANAQDKLSMDDLMDRFYRDYVDSTIWHGWYDLEFKRVTGVDIYDYPFDPAEGYARIREGNYDILVLRLETPDQIKEQAIAEFLDLPVFRLKNANVAQNKSYAAVYEDFGRRVHIPHEILDMNYNAKHTRHFYSPEEIARFRARWARDDR